MSWAGGNFEFKEKTKESAMMSRIVECLDRERGYMDPVHLPLKLLHEIPIQEDYEQAEQKLSDLYSRYGREYNYGVKYYSYPDIKPSKKSEDLKRRIRETEEKIETYSAAHSVSTFKAEYIGCPECGSKLKRTYLKSEKCPLCSADMRSATTLKTLAGYREKIKDLKKQLKEEEKKMQKKMLSKAEVYWLVSAEVYLG